MKAEAGIVDEQVDPLSSALKVRHQPGRGTRLRQIGGDGPGIAELGGKRLDPLGPPRDQHQPLAGFGQLAREFGAQAG